MLELTRHLDQGFKIGTDHKLFVRDVKPQCVTVRLYCSVYDVIAAIKYDHPYTVTIDGHAVKIHCLRIDRGQVRFGFEAPREISINRIERVQP